jgi:hypothetical protein
MIFPQETIVLRLCLWFLPHSNNSDCFVVIYKKPVQEMLGAELGYRVNTYTHRYPWHNGKTCGVNFKPENCTGWRQFGV